MHLLERETRDWVAAQVGQKPQALFEQGTQQAWAWTPPAAFSRWLTAGERRYGTA